MLTFGWIILWLPFITAILIASGLQSKPKAAALASTASIFACFFLTLALLFQYAKAVPSFDVSLESSLSWMVLNGLTIEYGILLNGLTLIMLLVVTGVGSLIFLYSMTYMKEDSGYARYFSCLSLFAFSMLGIVFANNLIQIFIHWELVGLSSYLLIGFWYEKFSASTAGKKAFLTTRVGDIGMMIGILMLLGLLAGSGQGSFNFLKIQAFLEQGNLSGESLNVIGLLIFLGVVGKSAQLPLHVWLPDAMEGPTPVSALIHAATMVAAGVFLLARLSFFYAAAPEAAQIIAWTGGVTALIAAAIAIVQDDIKKILAYSTLSQLGYMVMACGLQNSEAGMFHLTTHAFFKALLFLGAGSLIHAFHTQDIWEMKAPDLLKRMPVTSATFLIATFALMGIPPLSGFYSKEEILMTASRGPLALFVIAMAVVFLTAFYMGRLLTALLFSKKDSHASIHEADWKMTLPLIILAVFSAVGGFLPIKNFLGAHPAEHHGPSVILWVSLGLAFGGFLLSVWIHRMNKESPFRIPIFGFLETLLKRKFFFDDLYNLLISKVQDNAARLADGFERIVVVEGGVNGTARVTRKAGDWLRKLQTGIVQSYALIFVLGTVLLIGFFALGVGGQP